jgi:hypothetical protein
MELVYKTIFNVCNALNERQYEPPPLADGLMSFNIVQNPSINSAGLLSLSCLSLVLALYS